MMKIKINGQDVDLTSDELKAFLSENNEAVKGEGLLNKLDVDALIAGKTTGLINKNNELLKKVVDGKKDKDFVAGFQNDLDKFGITDYTELVGLLDKAKNPNDTDDMRAIKNEITILKADNLRFKADNENLTTINSNASIELKSMLVNNALKTKLMSKELGCTELQATALTTHLLSQTKFDVITNDNISKAITKDGKTPDQYIIDWSKTDAGKELLPQKINVGGGGTGSNNGGGGVKNLNQKLSDLNKSDKALSLNDQAALLAEIQKQKQEKN